MSHFSISVLGHSAVEQIHDASLKLLEDPGIKLEYEPVRRQLLAAGARPGVDAEVLRLPRELVADSLARAPEQVALASRTGAAPILLTPDGDRTCHWSVPGLHLWRHGEHRLFTAADMADVARLLDQLPEVDGVFGLAMNDVPPSLRDGVGLRIMAQHTRKHIRVLCFSPAGADVLCAMRPVVADTPWFSIGFTAHGPLRWTRLALEIFARTAGQGIPVSINGEPMAGVSGPVTLAGNAVVGNAEILAGLVVNQVLEPGRPCMYNLGLAHVFDMRGAGVLTGAPENHILAGIAAAMGRFYRLPSCSWVSTEALLSDSQAALEKTAGYLSHQQAGIDLIWGVGQLESEMTFSPAQSVIDNEIIAYTRRLLRPLAVDPETLALDEIRDVGIGGNFLECEHTMRHYRQEIYIPKLLFRGTREEWGRQGAPDLSRVAEAEADRLIAASPPPSLTDDQDRELCRIEAAFRAKYNESTVP